MNVTITDIPFETKEKSINVDKFLDMYFSYIQEKEDIKDIEEMKKEDKKWNVVRKDLDNVF